MLKYGEQVQTLLRHVRVWCRREGWISSDGLAKVVPLSVETQTGSETKNEKSPWRGPEFGWRLCVGDPRQRCACIFGWQRSAVFA